MLTVKEFISSYDNNEFYQYMGKFFAERIYRKELPYLVNDQEKIWYLFFEKDSLVGFCGVMMNQNSTTFSDFYLLPGHRTHENREFMASYMVQLYKSEKIRILTNSDEEMAVWEKLGFQKIGTKGSYATYYYGDKVCA